MTKNGDSTGINLKEHDRTKLLIDVAEMIIVALFAGLNWTSVLPLFPMYSRSYWLVFGLTVAYLCLLLFKFLHKYWHIAEDQEMESNKSDEKKT